MSKLSLPLAMSLALCATPALAGESYAVAFGDLDLSAKAGVAAFDARINHALRRACGFDAQERNMSAYVAQRRCMVAKRSEIEPRRAAAIAEATRPARALAAR